MYKRIKDSIFCDSCKTGIVSGTKEYSNISLVQHNLNQACFLYQWIKLEWLKLLRFYNRHTMTEIIPRSMHN